MTFVIFRAGLWRERPLEEARGDLGYIAKQSVRWSNPVIVRKIELSSEVTAEGLVKLQ